MMKAFIAEGVTSLMPNDAGEIPRAGRDLADAHGHVSVTYSFSLPKAQVNIPFQIAILKSMTAWLEGHHAVLGQISGDWRNPGVAVTEDDLGPIRHAGADFRTGEYAGSLEAWMVKTGAEGAAMIVRMTESLHIFRTTSPQSD